MKVKLLIMKSPSILTLLLLLVCPCGAQQMYKILNKDNTLGPVSKHLYGGFIELGFGRSDLLWSEMLMDPSFEMTRPLALKNNWFYFSREKREMEDWWHTGYEESMWYILQGGGKDYDIDKFLYTKQGSHGRRCMFLSNNEKLFPDYLRRAERKFYNGTMYLAQDSLYLNEGVTYRFTGFFGEGVFDGAERTITPVPIKIGLYADGDMNRPVATAILNIDAPKLRGFSATLDAKGYEGRATFAVEIPEGVNMVVDLFSLMPGNNVKGWRKDVVDILRDEIRPRSIRFPGGCYASWYNWRDGVGPREYRRVSYETFWNCEVMNDVGVVEYWELCKEVGAEPFYCVPLMFSDVNEIAELIDFCNNPNNERRISYGYKDPIRIEYWEMDNEPYRRYTAIEYAHKCAEYGKIMKQKDPSIKLVMGNYWDFNKKFAEMLEIAGPYIDVITNRGGSVKEMWNDISILKKYNAKHNRNIMLCHTELRPPLAKNSGGVNGLNRVFNDQKESMFNRCVRWEYAMSTIDQFIEYQNMDGYFYTGHFTNLSDGWGEGLINCAKEKAYMSSVGVAYDLLNSLEISYPQVIEVVEKTPGIVMQAAWNDNRDKLTLLILNFDEKVVIHKVDLKEIKTKFASEAHYYEVAPESKNSFNSTENSDRVKVTKGTISAKKVPLTLKLKPHSAFAVELKVAGK